MCAKKWWWLTAGGAVLGLAAYAGAGPVQSLSNRVANGAIAVDGIVSDWETLGVAPFMSDATDTAGQPDWTRLWVAHDDTYIYFREDRAPGSMTFSNSNNYPLLYLDTDQDQATGANALWSTTPNLSVGGNFAFAGTECWRYGKGGSSCVYSQIPPSRVGVGEAGIMEYEGSIPRSSLANPATSVGAVDFNFAFRGFNANNWSGDFYPDGARTDSYFHYTTDAPIPPDSRPVGMLESLSNRVANGSIVIDGDMGDWAGVAPYPVDPTDFLGGQDFARVWIAHDDNNFYFRIQRAPGSAVFSGYWEGWIDTDRNTATGYPAGSWPGYAPAIGADWILFGQVGFYGEPGDVGPVPWLAMAPPADSGPLSRELSLRRADLGDPAAINILCVGATLGGVVYDYYPDGGNSPTGDYFTYVIHDPSPPPPPVSVAAERSNPVPNGSINAGDGVFDDWAGIPSYPQDAVGDGGTSQDWVKATIAHDDDNVYFLVEGAPDPALTLNAGGYRTVIDTDLNSATGYRGTGVVYVAIGGEYALEFGVREDFWTADGCLASGTSPITGAAYSADLRKLEFSLSRTTLGLTDPLGKFYVTFAGRTSLDYYPDGGDVNKTFLYKFVHCGTPFADADEDGDVDQDDFGAFQKCYSGSGTPFTAINCACFDRDNNGEAGDSDVDATDLVKFLNCFGGPAMSPLSTCGQ